MIHANIHLHADDDNNKYDLHPFLKPLTEQLALQHPTWVFEGKRYSHRHINNISYRVATSIKITEKREEIGSYEVGAYNKKDCYSITNKRISAARERGDSTKTTDIKKAIKVINKFVSRQTILEKVSEAQKAAESAVGDVRAVKSRMHSSLYSALMPTVTKLLVDQWDTLSPSMNLTADTMRFPEAVRESLVAEHIQTAYNTGNGHLVLIDGLDYALKKGDEEVVLLRSDQLPDEVKGKIGILKLVEVSQIVENVGIRARENVFFVLS